MTVEPLQPFIEPIRKSVTVGRTQSEAFEIFARRLSSWWPMASHSISQERTKNVQLEPWEGGRIYETRDDGEQFPWGEVLVWEEPSRLVLSWHPGQDPSTAQEVEVLFEKVADGTRVQLEHRNWQKRGDGAKQARDHYNSGWSSVFGVHFVQACA